MSGRSSKETGARYERELVAEMEALGFKAERIYGSGFMGTIHRQKQVSTAQHLDGDVYVDTGKTKYTIEVKYRSNFPKWLRGLKKPTRIGDFGFYPGLDIEAATNFDFKKKGVPKWSKATKQYKNWILNSDILMCRFPRPTKEENSTGWVILIPL